jgi:protein-tyrosine phosphatase
MFNPLSLPRLANDRRRLTIAARYAFSAVLTGTAGLGIGGSGLWLLWPAISLASVAGNYAFFGPKGFNKQPDGRMGAAALLLFAPYQLGAWINSRMWTYGEPAAVSLRQDIMLGRIPSHREAARFRTIIDLCAELPATNRHVEWHVFPMLDLVTPEVSQLRAAVAAIESAKAKGPLLVCCALGYSRSVCALAAWLLTSGNATNLTDAIRQIRRVRPRLVLHDADRVAINQAASRENG